MSEFHVGDGKKIEVSISVPCLVSDDVACDVADDVAACDVKKEEQRRSAVEIKNERRVSNRQKLLAMKRFSGFLKRPEILGELVLNNIC